MAEIEIKVDNTKAVQADIKKALAKGLEMVGLQAEGYAKKYITAQGAVDTGNLRNSITHTTDDEAAYIGTNVEYAPYVELGTSKMKARPYLEPAAANHADEYGKIIKSCIENA